MNLLTLTMLGTFLFIQSSASAPQRIVTAAQVNGTWESKSGTFKILALGKQKLRVEFSGVYLYKLADGTPTANTGEGSGIATIEGTSAKFKPDGAEDECLITMTFARGKLEVTQQSICGFGRHVTAAGKYRRVSARRPRFTDN